MIKEGCENKSALLIHLIFYLKKSQKSNLSLDNNNLKWGGNIIMKLDKKVCEQTLKLACESLFSFKS